MPGLTLERSVSNFKSVLYLTVLELLAFNAPNCLIDRFVAYTQSDENIISANSLRSLGGDKKKKLKQKPNN